jgi:hypothetical protein
MRLRAKDLGQLVRNQSTPEVERHSTLGESNDDIDESPAIPRRSAQHLEQTAEAMERQADAYPEDAHRDEAQVEGEDACQAGEQDQCHEDERDVQRGIHI